MKLTVLHSNRKYTAHIRYIFECLARTLGAKRVVFSGYEEPAPAFSENELVVSYGPNPPNSPTHIHITEADLFGGNYLQPESLPGAPLPCHGDLPILYGKKPEPGEWIEETADKITSHIDLVAGIFFLLTRYEELVLTGRDRFGRFSSESSLLKNAGLLDRPLADEYVDLFCSWAIRLNPGFRKTWEKHRTAFSFYMTHDVDAPWKYTWKRVLKHPGWRGVSSLLDRKRDPWWTFPAIMEMEKRFGIRSDCFFLAGGRHPLDRGYSLEHPRLRDLVRELKDRGCGIGIHFSLGAHLSLASSDSGVEKRGEFARELTHFIAVTGETAIGSRQHYLAFRTPETWRRLASLSIPFDASLGFPEIPGFRCGTCRPFRCFDAERGRDLNIHEIPLIAMDTSLILHMNLSPEEAFESLLQLFLTVKRSRGVFTFLLHNNYLCEGDYPGWKGLFERFLRRVREENPVLYRPLFPPV